MEEGNTEFQKSQQLEASFNRTLQEGRQSGEPEISINIFYSPHVEGHMVEGLRKQFDQADIYVPESVGWTPDSLQVGRDVCEGRVPLSNIERMRTVDPFTYRELLMMNNSHKPTIIVDLPEGHPLIKKHEDLQIEEVTMLNKATFTDTLNAIINFYKADADIQVQREVYMLSQLRPKIREAMAVYPHLKAKKEINVLMSLGSAHTLLYSELKKQKVKVERTFGSRPYWGYRHEGTRRYIFNKDIDQQLAAKIFLEYKFSSIFSFYLRGLTENSADILLLSRRIISLFSFEEAKEIFEASRKDMSLKSIFEAKFSSKRINLPKSPAQLDEFLVKPLPRRDTMQE